MIEAWWEEAIVFNVFVINYALVCIGLWFTSQLHYNGGGFSVATPAPGHADRCICNVGKVSKVKGPITEVEEHF